MVLDLLLVHTTPRFPLALLTRAALPKTRVETMTEWLMKSIKSLGLFNRDAGEPPSDGQLDSLSAGADISNLSAGADKSAPAPTTTGAAANWRGHIRQAQVKVATDQSAQPSASVRDLPVRVNRGSWNSFQLRDNDTACPPSAPPQQGVGAALPSRTRHQGGGATKKHGGQPAGSRRKQPEPGPQKLEHGPDRTAAPCLNTALILDSDVRKVWSETIARQTAVHEGHDSYESHWVTLQNHWSLYFDERVKGGEK